MSVDEEIRAILDSTVRELVSAALQAGFDIRDLNQLLDSGLDFGIFFLRAILARAQGGHWKIAPGSPPRIKRRYIIHN